MGYTPGQLLGGITVTIGTLVLGQVDAAGVAWTVAPDGLQGWDGPDVRATWTDRQADHGAWAGPGYFGARVITVAGTVTAPDAGTLATALEQLAAAVALTDTTLVVGEPTPRQATVRRSAKLLVARQTDRVATYSVQVTAADPRRYSTTQQTATVGLPSTSGGLAPPLTPPLTIPATTTPGTVTASNAGTIATRPLLTLTGPVAQPVIITTYPDGSTRTLSYSDSLATGDVLVIDTDAHTVVLNGSVSRRRYLSLSGQWPDIPAGGTVTVAYRAAATTTSTCSVSWRSAWQ